MSPRPIHVLAGAVLFFMPSVVWADVPETVYFASADGRTEIVGYLYRPAGNGPFPAMVLLHGRGGLYSTNANIDCALVARSVVSPCNAATLSERHQMWGEYWAKRGYLALFADSFGPRGKGRGFGRDTHGDPEREDVNERTVRPLDAEGALAYMKGRGDVIANDIFLQGWSNGASTALNVLFRQEMKRDGFRAVLAFYPGCGEQSLLGPTLATATRVTLLLGSADEEVSSTVCQRFAERSRAAGSPLDVILYQGATHDFDDPGRRRQTDAANRAAQSDALQRAVGLIDVGRDN